MENIAEAKAIGTIKINGKDVEFINRLSSGPGSKAHTWVLRGDRYLSKWKSVGWVIQERGEGSWIPELSVYGVKVKVDGLDEGMSGLLGRLEELVERKTKMAGLTWLSLADPRHGTLSYMVDMGQYIYTLRELDPVKGVWGIQVRGGLGGKDGVLLKKRFEWGKADNAGDAIRGVSKNIKDDPEVGFSKPFPEDPPVLDAAKYVASGKASKDVEGKKYVVANKRMWGI